MKIGVYVGSFNPIHKGHIKIVNYLIENNYVDKVIIIPTGNYWNKQDLIDVEKRIKMTRFYENRNIYVDDQLNNLPYTYQVLNELKKILLKNELYLIIGADNLEKFHLWNNIEEILNHKVLVIPRKNINPYEYINKFMQKESFVVTDKFPLENISSTMIRELIEQEEYDLVLPYIDKEILNYIIENNLYSKKDKKLVLKKDIEKIIK